LIAPKTSLFQSKQKTQEARLHAIESYFNALLPVVCMKTELATFFDVPINLFSGSGINSTGGAEKDDSISLNVDKPVSPLLPLSDKSDDGSSTPVRQKGNTFEADKIAHETLKQFHKKNRKLLELLAPPTTVASAKTPDLNRVRSFTLHNTNQPVKQISNSLLHASTAPGSRRDSLERRGSMINGQWVPMTAAWSAHTTGSTRGSIVAPMHVNEGDYKLRPNMDSTLDFSKLSINCHGEHVEDKSSRAISPNAPVAAGSAAISRRNSGSKRGSLSKRGSISKIASGTCTPSRGVPSRSVARGLEPVSLQLRNGTKLNGFAPTGSADGWFYARDAAGNECYYRSAPAGGHAAMVLQANLGLPAPAVPPLPRRGTIYQRNALVIPLRKALQQQSAAASMPVSLATSRTHSPERAPRTMSVIDPATTISNVSQSVPHSPRSLQQQALSREKLSHKRTSHGKGSLIQPTNLHAFRSSLSKRASLVPNVTKEECAQEIFSPKAGESVTETIGVDSAAILPMRRNSRRTSMLQQQQQQDPRSHRGSIAARHDSMMQDRLPTYTASTISKRNSVIDDAASGSRRGSIIIRPSSATTTADPTAVATGSGSRRSSILTRSKAISRAASPVRRSSTNANTSSFVPQLDLKHMFSCYGDGSSSADLKSHHHPHSHSRASISSGSSAQSSRRSSATSSRAVSPSSRSISKKSSATTTDGTAQSAKMLSRHRDTKHTRSVSTLDNQLSIMSKQAHTSAAGVNLTKSGLGSIISRRLSMPNLSPSNTHSTLNDTTAATATAGSPQQSSNENKL
jgi:hypothetical protein